MAIHAFHLFSEHMGFMGEFDVVERNSPFFDPDMAEGRAGHLCLKFFRFIIPVEGCQHLFGPIVGYIEELEGILNIMGALPQVNEVVIVARFIQEILSLFKLRRPRSVLFRFLENSLDIGDALTGFVFRL